MTAEEAAKVALAAKAKRLVLLHISPRYTRAQEQVLAQEAREQFPQAEVSEELQRYSVPLVS